MSTRIAILNAYDQVLTFMDNDVREALHYFDDNLHTYLNGQAYTFDFTVLTSQEDSRHLREGNKVAFRHAGTDYYLTIVQTERTETETVCTAYGLSFEFINEEVDAIDHTGTFEDQLTAIGFEMDNLHFKAKDVPQNAPFLKSTAHIKRDSRESILARIYALAEAHGAEVIFRTHLKRNYALDRIDLLMYELPTEEAGKKSGRQIQGKKAGGAGADRSDTVIHYGEGVQSITKTVDMTDFYTALRPRGKSWDEVTTKKTTVTKYKVNGNVQNALTETTVTTTTKSEKVTTTETVTTFPNGYRSYKKTKKTENPDGSSTTVTEADTTTGKKPDIPDGALPEKTENEEETTVARTLNLSGFDLSKADKSGKYVLAGEDLRCPASRDLYPSALKKDSSGHFADGYIVRYFDCDAETQEDLAKEAIKELSTHCMPKVTYKLDGQIPGDIGDWVLIEDAQYKEPLYLYCRIVEQEVSLSDPSECSTTFDNFTEVASQLSQSVQSSMAAMKAELAVYQVSISSQSGLTIKNGEGTIKVCSHVRQDGLIPAEALQVIWYLDGVASVKDAATTSVNGETVLTIEAGDFTNETMRIKCKAFSRSGKFRGEAEVTAQIINDGDSLVITQTEEGAVISSGKQSASVLHGISGKDGYSPSVNMSKSGKTTTLAITDKSATHVTQIIDGSNGRDGTNGTDGFSPTISTSKSGKTTTLTITDKNGSRTAQVKDGADGKDAPTITSITGYYYRSTSQTTVPADSSFSTTRPTLTTTYKYLWTYDRYSMSDGTALNGPKHIAAVYGDTGQTGSPGAAGNDAKTISGISTVWAPYSASYTSAPGNSSFSDSKPTTISSNQRLWRAEKISYSDGSSLITNKRCVYAKTSISANESSGFIRSITLERTEHNGVIRFRGYVSAAASSEDICTFNLPDLCGMSFAWANYFTTKSNALSTAIQIALGSDGVLKITAKGALTTSNHLDFEIPIIIP